MCLPYTRGCHDNDDAAVVITAFGWVYLPLLAGIALLRAVWLPPLLVVAAVLHAPAVAVIGAKPYGGGTGISPWFITALVACIHLTVLVVRRRGLSLGESLAMRRSTLGWSVFFGLAIVSSFALPWLFAGTEVHALGHRRGFGIAPTPLQWSVSNLVQAVNSAMLWLVMLYVLQVAHTPGITRRLAIGTAGAVATALLLALWQRAQILEILPTLQWFQLSLNPSYVQRVGGGVDGIARIPWPFPEPSYSAVFLAAIYAGGLALFLFTRRVAVGAALALAGLLGAANSLGVAGIATAAFATIVLLALAAFRLVRHGSDLQANLRTKFWGLMLALVAAVACGFILDRIPMFERFSIQMLTSRLLEPRLAGVEPSGASRAASHVVAMSVLLETFGLGAGLGSNRASSYVASLLSNVGLLPSLLFLGLLGHQIRLLARVWQQEPAAVFILAGLPTMLVGVALAIPDLNWPALWVWIIFSFCLNARAAHQTGEHDRSPGAAPCRATDPDSGMAGTDRRV